MSDIKEEKKKFRVILVNEITLESFTKLMMYLWTLKDNKVYEKVDINKLLEEKIFEFNPYDDDINSFKTTILLKDEHDN